MEFFLGQQILVVTESQNLPILKHIDSQIGCTGKIEILSPKELNLPSLSFRNEQFDVIMDTGLHFHPDSILFEFSRILKPGGVLFFQEPILSSNKEKLSGMRTKEEMESSIMISGLEIEKFEGKKTLPIENHESISKLCAQLETTKEKLEESSKKGIVEMAEVTVKKASIELGSSHSLSWKKKPQEKKAKIEKVPIKTNEVWKISLEDLEDDQLEFVEEEKLLLGEDLLKQKITEFDPNDDCGTGKGKQKACKNCTCGRADGNFVEKPSKKITLEDLEKGIDLPESSCGSCFLGDAFRCPGCPMLGLPAFKPGQKVKLNQN